MRGVHDNLAASFHEVGSSDWAHNTPYTFEPPLYFYSQAVQHIEHICFW